MPYAWKQRRTVTKLQQPEYRGPARLTAGIVAGLIFHYGQQFFGQLSLVFHTDPLMAAVVPPALCLILGIWLLQRVR